MSREPENSLAEEIRSMAKSARAAARKTAALESSRKNEILRGMAAQLRAAKPGIQAANTAETERARRSGLSAAMCDRLLLTDSRYESMVTGLLEVAALPDPVGAELLSRERPNGLLIKKIRVPIGVIGIIYEARPNVTADAASLCIKSGNSVILRGGSEALETNRLIAEALSHGGASAGLPEGAVQFIPSADRAAVKHLVQLEGLVDLIIPRGGESLIRAVVEMARVPVLKHYKGVCHVFVDESADLDMALRISENAKCQRPGVCNAMETLLVHKNAAARFLPRLAELLMPQGVELRGDETVRKLIPEAKAAAEDDWYAEYLDLVLAVKVVPDAGSAVDHINTYGSGHTDAIITRSKDSERLFLQEVDSGVVCVNASTRFNDGGQFGMGAEMGISTDKVHARGPVGLEELTTYKYLVLGEGQIRE